MSGKRDWEEWEIIRLIEMWRDSEILYNNLHASYYVTHERRAVLETIAQELDVSIKEIQVRDICSSYTHFTNPPIKIRYTKSDCWNGK